MLRKIGQVSLGVVCLIAVSSFVYAAGETATAADTPTIGELSASAETPQQPAEPPAPAAAAGTVAKTPEEILAEFTAKREIEKQAKKAQAADLVKQAHQLLIIENRPADAKKLAVQALLLDPDNKEADDLRIEAGVQLGEKSETLRAAQDTGLEFVPLRVQAAKQALTNAIVSARHLYSVGRYEEAIEQLGKARMNIDMLSVYTNVSKERGQVEEMMADAQKAFEAQGRTRAAQMKREGAAAAEEQIKQMADDKRQSKARAAEEVMELIRDAKFEEATQVIDDMEMLDPADLMIEHLRERLASAQNDFVQSRQQTAMARGDQKVEQDILGMETVPPRIFNYPSKRVWQDVIDVREPKIYPSQTREETRTPEDRRVYEQLQMPVSLRFDGTLLPQVVEFLQETTDVSYSLRRQDLPMDQGPVTLAIDTTLENGLNQICELTGMAWKVDGGLVKIGSPESLRSYDMRIYNVTDLLLSTEDRSGGNNDENSTGGTGGFGRSSGGSSTGFGGGGSFGRFGSPSGAPTPQFGGSSSSSSSNDDDDDDDISNVTSRAENLILLIKQACGDETWEDLFGAVLIDSGGTTQGSGTGGGGGGGATISAGGTGFGAGGGGFGSPYGGGPGGPGEFGPYAGGAGFGAPTGFGGPTGVGTGAPVQLPRGRAFVMANDPANIMVVQTPEVHKCIERLLKDLRASMKVQIQVDVRFLSVSADFLREVGFNWNSFNLNPDGYDEFGNLDGFGLSSGAYGGYAPWVQPTSNLIFDQSGALTGVLAGLPFGFGHPYTDPGFTFDDTTLTYTFTKATATGTPFMNTGIPFFGADTGGLALDFGYSGAFDLSGYFKMGHARDELKTLSAPTITLANGQLGYITVATQIDYVNTYTVTSNTLVPTIATVSDAVQLEVRPIASADLKYVFLEMIPTILQTDLSNTVSYTTFVGQPGGGGTTGGGASGAAVQNFFTLPRINQQTLETTVGVPDRGILVVGGLTTSERRHHEGGVPILDKIPIIKRLFSAEGRKVARDRLFVMASPRIIIIGEEEKRMR